MQSSEQRWQARLWFNTAMESSSESQQEPEKTLVSQHTYLYSSFQNSLTHTSIF